MKTTTLAVSVLCALAGCAANPLTDGQPVRVEPFERTTHAVDRAEALYQTGRYFQGQLRYAEAILAYQEVLAANASHVEAHNGLGVAFSSLSQHELAEQHFRRAIELAPGARHLYNNLGYAYLRAGRHEEARSLLEQARRMDPEDSMVLANLALVAQQIGVNAAIMQTKTLGERTAMNPLEAVGGPTAADTNSERARASASRLVQVVPNVFELRLAEFDAAPVIAPPAIRNPVVRLEVSNGNGVRGMAREAARHLRGQGFPQARLTNQRPYRQGITEIHYLAGFEAEAARLNAVMPQQVLLVAAPKLERGMQVRVVLGRDLPRQLANFWREQQPIKLAANEMK